MNTRTETWMCGDAKIAVEVREKFTKAEFDEELMDASLIERDDWRLSRLAKLKTSFARSNCKVNVGDRLKLNDGTECTVQGYSCGMYKDYPYLTIAIKVGKNYGLTVPDRIREINGVKFKYKLV